MAGRVQLGVPLDPSDEQRFRELAARFAAQAAQELPTAPHEWRVERVTQLVVAELQHLAAAGEEWAQRVADFVMGQEEQD